MIIKDTFSLLICVLALLCNAIPSSAQEISLDETLRVRHRVVFMDALVKDKRTGLPISDLKEGNFEVLADGKPRPISYFSREGDAKRRPLALVLVLDLGRVGAGRFLRRTEILEALANEIAKLPPEDEVAVLGIDVGATGGKREWLVHFTRDRAQVAAALAIVPTLVAAGSEGPTDASEQPAIEPKAESKPATENDKKNDVKVESDKKEGETQTGSDKDDGEVVTKIVGADGSMVTKTLHKDGTLTTKRTSKDGTTNVELNDSFDLSGATFEVTRLAASERPNSQTAMVLVTDGILPIFYADRDDSAAMMIRSNVIFSALVVDMKMGLKLFMPVLKPLGNWVGLSIYGSAQHLAKQTGGEVARVRRPEDYANGLNKIFGNLTSRYSLGFALAEQEQDDGRMHNLEVRVKARDAKGKERKLEVSSRRGFFMPKQQEAAR